MYRVFLSNGPGGGRRHVESPTGRKGSQWGHGYGGEGGSGGGAEVFPPGTLQLEHCLAQPLHWLLKSTRTFHPSQGRTLHPSWLGPWMGSLLAIRPSVTLGVASGFLHV